MTFDELNLAPAILEAVRDSGYHTPTPIQQQAIPAVLQGLDLLAGAQTGTGKTAAFTLPMLHRLSQGQATKNRAGNKGIRALVLTPTRELAAQVEESVRTYGKHLALTSTAIFGGVGLQPQIERIRRGVDILVATPGRLLDLHQQGFADLSGVQMLVLDEADRMLDMGFIYDVKKILAAMPKDKQSLLFSATFSDEIRELAGTLLKNPQSIQVTPSNTTVQNIAQLIHPVGRAKKKQALLHIIEQHNWSQVLVFTRTKFGANNVAEFLSKNGVNAMPLHGNKSQSARTQALAGFKSGSIRALVATDIAARGIDIDDLPHVVNYEIPNVPEDYVHRIGRTGRAGASGQALSLVCMDEEGFMMEIERFTRQQIPVQRIDGFGPDAGEQAEPIAMGRQTIWGGAGNPPGREVMQAAARAARSEMLERMRANRSAMGERGGPRQPAHGGAGAGPGARHTQGAQNRPGPRQANGHAQEQPQGEPGGQGQGPRQFNSGAAGANRGNPGARPPRGAAPQPRARGPRPQQGGGGYRHDDAQPPRPNAHLGTHGGLGSPKNQRPAPQPGGQPDPMRTSVDSMAERGRHGAGGYRGGAGGGGGGSYGGGAGNRGNAPRGPGGARGSFNRGY